MKIVFDLTPIYDHLSGIERYNINITKSIINAHPENNYVLLFKNEIHNLFLTETDLNYVESIVIPGCNKLLFIQWKLYNELKKIQADYFFFLSFTSPVLFKDKGIVNAIHDLTCWDCPESIPTKMKYYYRVAYHFAIKRSFRIITVSKYSQKRICEKYNLAQEKVSVVYDGLTSIFGKDINYNSNDQAKYGLPDKYILSLSTIEPRKNLQLLIRAYKELVNRLDNVPDLVLAGRSGWKTEKILGEICESVRSRIRFTGFIEDEDLPNIYQKADIFVFPSKYEGFGLPVIEAMSQGTLVVCSNAASLPEVAEDAGILFDSDDCDSLVKALINAIHISDKEKKERIEKGKKISGKYVREDEAEKAYRLLK